MPELWWPAAVRPSTDGSHPAYPVGYLRSLSPIPYAAPCPHIGPGQGTCPSGRQALQASIRRRRPAVIAALRGRGERVARPSPRSPVSSTASARPCEPAISAVAPRRRTSLGSGASSSSTTSVTPPRWAPRKSPVPEPMTSPTALGGIGAGIRCTVARPISAGQGSTARPEVARSEDENARKLRRAESVYAAGTRRDCTITWISISSGRILLMQTAVKKLAPALPDEQWSWELKKKRSDYV